MTCRGARGTARIRPAPAQPAPAVVAGFAQLRSRGCFAVGFDGRPSATCSEPLFLRSRSCRGRHRLVQEDLRPTSPRRPPSIGGRSSVRVYFHHLFSTRMFLTIQKYFNVFLYPFRMVGEATLVLMEKVPASRRLTPQARQLSGGSYFEVSPLPLTTFRMPPF